MKQVGYLFALLNRSNTGDNKLELTGGTKKKVQLFQPFCNHFNKMAPATKHSFCCS